MTVLIRILALVGIMVSMTPASATIVYSNDFETNTNGFTTTGVGTVPAGVSFTKWLGGDKSLHHGSSTSLSLTGLSVGTVYNVAFDLYLGGTWDGSGAFGPDYFQFSTSSAGFLVNATFVNDFPIGGGSGKTQTYSDSTPLGDGGEFIGRTGADVVLGEPIYYFGHGAGNPLLSFTATTTSEILHFAAFDYQQRVDEFFALDNVVVSNEDAPVPEPATLALLSLGVICLGFNRRKRR